MFEEKIQLIPARVAHNRTLLDKYLDANKCHALFPPVAQQHPSHIVSLGLFDGGYNPSILKLEGVTLMAYRYHHDGGFATRLAIAELDDKFNVIKNQALDLNDEALSHEDPRLFHWLGAVWMSYVSSDWPNFPSATVRYARLTKPDHWRAESPIDYVFPTREQIEKNHTPLPLGDGMAIIYRHNPSQIVYVPGKQEPITSEALTWPYGEIRGGTAPLIYKDNWLKFFHSSLRNDMPPVFHRYYVGAMLIEQAAPYKMVAVSKKPILFGSEAGGDTTRKHFKKNVVFPAGAFSDKGKIFLSVGVNDSQCAVVELSASDLNL